MSTDFIKPAPMVLSCRLSLFIICLCSTFTFMLQRVAIGFALVCMLKRPSNSSYLIQSNATGLSLFITLERQAEDQECQRQATTNSSQVLADQGEFDWSREVQGSILGSFYYGYLFTQIFGGWLAERFGPRLGLISSLMSISLLTILNPIAAAYGPEYLFGIRLVMGLTHGAALSSINIFSVRWCAPGERAFLMGICYGGFSIAAAFTFPLCAFLCRNFGWKFIFYVSGGFGLLVVLLAYFLVYDWPVEHPRISERELTYLQNNSAVQCTNGKRQKQITPWRKIFGSISINVVHITHMCFVWGFLMFGMYLPTFMKEVLYFDTTKNGLYSSLPYMCMLMVHFSVGSIFDYFRKKDVMSLTNLRKTFNTIGMVAPACALMMTGFLSCSDPVVGIVIISIAQSLAEFGFMGGYMFSIFELAPKYAGVLTGITNTFGVIPGFLCPALVAYLTPNGSREEWIIVFLFAGALNIFGAIVYILFGSSEIRPWAKTDQTKTTEMKYLKEHFINTNNQK